MTSRRASPSGSGIDTRSQLLVLAGIAAILRSDLGDTLKAIPSGLAFLGEWRYGDGVALQRGSPLAGESAKP